MSVNIKLPPQKKRFKQKTVQWGKDCVNAIESGISYNTNQEVRDSIQEKHINSRLFDGILTMSDVATTISSAGVLEAYVPKKIQNRPLLRPKIELLVGEATKEPFEWAVMVTDPNSISRKVEKKKELVNEKILALLKSELSDEELAIKLKDLDRYFKYTWKDIKEVRATKILKYYWDALKLEEKFNTCMLNKLVIGEEIMMFDIVGNDVVAFELDPKKVHTLQSSQSNKISDADIILVEEYWSPGKIIDHYYDELKPDDIDRLNSGSLTGDEDTNYNSDFTKITDGIIIDGMINTVQQANPDYTISSSIVDKDGNYRVLRTLWRSQKLILLVSGIDPDSGESYEKVMSEEYIVDPLKGEKSKKLWVEEWWQGAKIADIYLSIKPRPVQFRSQSNLSKGHPGIVGHINSVSGGKTVSFLSKMKPYQYLYNIVWDRLLDELKKNLGNLVEMDLAKKPTGWNISKWLTYAYKGGIMFVDSFKEATKGAAIGKLSGAFNTTGKTITTSTGNLIQQYVNLLEYIKKELAEIVGVTPQREGMIQASATVGSTERSVMQSNNSTAYEFYTHQEFKLESLNILLQTAKVALKGNKKIAQNILDDFSLETFEVEGDDFIESDYSVFLTVSRKSKDMQRSLELYSQAFMQNGGTISTVLDILFSDSIAEKRRKIESAETAIREERAAQQEQAAKMQEQALTQQAQEKQQDIDLKVYEIDSDNSTKVLIEEIKQKGAEGKLDLETDLSSKEILFKIKELNETMKLEREKDQTKKEIARMKPKVKQQ